MLDRRVNYGSVGRHKHVQPGISGLSSARKRNRHAGYITDTAEASTAFTFVSTLRHSGHIYKHQRRRGTWAIPRSRPAYQKAERFTDISLTPHGREV